VAMYPHERSLVKRLEDKPFALLGINSDTDKDALKKVMEKQHITWRSFWNGPDGTSGPISTKWNVQGWPTTYVVDAKGMIRFKNVREEAMDKAVNQLFKEMGIGGLKDESKEPEKSKVAEDVNALITANQKAMRDFTKNNEEKLKNAKTDEERGKINGGYPKPDETRAKLWALLEKNPNDKEASFTALQWLLYTYFQNDEESQKGRAKALDLLIKDHADNPKIVPVLNNLSIYVYYSLQVEELLRAVLAKNPSNDAKAIACFNLGVYMKKDAEGVRKLKESPGEGKNMEYFLGKEDAMKLKGADADKLAKEAEAVLEEAAAKYGDVQLYHPAVSMIADQVARELFELRNLAIGKTAPDIVGDDLYGKPLKLSDYRGKVVVLYFQGNRYSPGRDMHAYERSLVKRLEGKPFALVGVNSDTDKDELKKAMEKEHITWRSFWDGAEGERGPIFTKWNVNGRPTTYVIDAKGTIRFKDARGGDMDRAVDRLLKEMEKDGK
jgi:peroxiredoxin